MYAGPPRDHCHHQNRLPIGGDILRLERLPVFYSRFNEAI